MKNLRETLIIVAALLTYGCGSTSSNTVEPFEVTQPPTSSAKQQEEFNKADALDRAGENKLANEIWQKLANQGHVPSLNLYAIKQYSQHGEPIYYEATEPKGCQRKEDSRMEFDGVPVHSYRTNFAIKKLAEQGNLQAANIHFECEVGRFDDRRGIPPTNAVSVIKYAAGKGDIRALNNLVDFELSYYANPSQYRHDRAASITKKYRFRIVEIENAARWATQSFEASSLETNIIDSKTINAVIESQVKVAGTFQYQDDDFTNAAIFYNNARKLCYSANANWPERKGRNFSVDSTCELANNRYEALSEL